MPARHSSDRRGAAPILNADPLPGQKSDSIACARIYRWYLLRPCTQPRYRGMAVPAQQIIGTQHANWDALRIGLKAETMLFEDWRVSADVAYLPGPTSPVAITISSVLKQLSTISAGKMGEERCRTSSAESVSASALGTGQCGPRTTAISYSTAAAAAAEPRSFRSLHSRSTAWSDGVPS